MSTKKTPLTFLNQSERTQQTTNTFIAKDHDTGELGFMRTTIFQCVHAVGQQSISEQQA